MGRRYKRKTNHSSFDLLHMEKAVKLVEDGHSYQSAADSYPNIHVKTFWRYVQKKRQNTSYICKMVTEFNFKKVFTDGQEIAFVDYIKVRALMAYGMTQPETKESSIHICKG